MEKKTACGLKAAHDSQCWHGLGPASWPSPSAFGSPRCPGARLVCGRCTLDTWSLCWGTTSVRGTALSGSSAAQTQNHRRGKGLDNMVVALLRFFSCRSEREMLGTQFDSLLVAGSGKEGAHRWPVGGACVMHRGRQRKRTPAMRRGAK
jgi:hypothetical protein